MEPKREHTKESKAAAPAAKPSAANKPGEQSSDKARRREHPVKNQTREHLVRIKPPGRNQIREHPGRSRENRIFCNKLKRPTARS